MFTMQLLCNFLLAISKITLQILTKSTIIFLFLFLFISTGELTAANLRTSRQVSCEQRTLNLLGLSFIRH